MPWPRMSRLSTLEKDDNIVGSFQCLVVLPSTLLKRALQHISSTLCHGQMETCGKFSQILLSAFHCTIYCFTSMLSPVIFLTTASHDSWILTALIFLTNPEHAENVPGTLLVPLWCLHFVCCWLFPLPHLFILENLQHQRWILKKKVIRRYFHAFMGL